MFFHRGFGGGGDDHQLLALEMHSLCSMNVVNHGEKRKS